MIDLVLLLFLKNSLGKSYSLTMGKLLRRNSKEFSEGSEKKNYFCSELVADAFKHAGILNQTISCSRSLPFIIPCKWINRYWPGDFSNEKKLTFLNGVSLGTQRYLVNEFDKRVKKP